MISFQKRDPHKTAERERIVRESVQAADEATGAAQNCLNAEEFKKYREAYGNLERKLFEELVWIDQTEMDPVKYGFMVKDVIAKMRHIGSLMRGVYQDAGKEV